MESPVKKLDFNPADKENLPVESTDLATLAKNMDEQQSKSVVEEVKPSEPETKTDVVAGVKSDEADEPLLQENPQRFVLFPIKYHEVSIRVTTRKVVRRRDTLC